MEKLSGHFIVEATKPFLNWMCEISVLEHKQTETKEYRVEIGSVSKRGGGSTSGIQGHRKAQHVSAQQCQQGHKFSTHLESISHREWRTWKEAYQRHTEILHLELLDLEPRFFFLSFFFLNSIYKLGDPVKWSFQEPDGEPVASEKRRRKKRDCSGFNFGIKFMSEKKKTLVRRKITS